MAFQVTSAALAEGQALPIQYSCDGDGISPPLAWSDAPEATESFVVVCLDPDAPRGTFVHWLVFALPPGTTGLTEGLPHQNTLAAGGKQGINSANGWGYHAPCPPRGESHRYVFHVYALDDRLELPGPVTFDKVRKTMQGHVLAEATLTTTYARAERKAA